MQIKTLLLAGFSSNQLAQIKSQIIKSQNPHILNSLLSSLTKTRSPLYVFSLYNQMLQTPNTHNHFTFNIALKTCCLTNSFNKGQEIHAHVIKTGHFYHTYIQNSLIHFYVIRNEIDHAYRVFESIDYPNVVSWTSIVSGFSKCGFEEKAIQLFSEMDVEPNANTLVSVLSACCGCKVLKLGRSVHCYGIKNLDRENLIFDNALLNFYLKDVGSLETARQVFDNMPKRDVVSWTTMVSGHVESGFSEIAMNVFDEMVKLGEVKPNEATIVNVVSACASIGSLSLCERVHRYVQQERPDIRIEGNVGNALVNMYVKCGSMGDAIRVFKAIRFKDIVTWSTMISGVAMNGLGGFALPLFNLMLVHGIEPDDVTFISLLTACSHTGLVDEGLMLFKAMVNTYGINAHQRHCACVVDMYARAGRLKEAEEFVMGMLIEPDGPIWGALVSACRIYGNQKMLQRVSRLLIERGASGGTLALVSNSYACSNRWDESIEIRNVMSCLGLKKAAGASWIELDV